MTGWQATYATVLSELLPEGEDGTPMVLDVLDALASANLMLQPDYEGIAALEYQAALAQPEGWDPKK